MAKGKMMSSKTNGVRKTNFVKQDNGTFVENKGWKKVIRFSEPSVYEQVQNNDTSAYNPEHWAAESVATLVESMVFAGTVHTDFNDEIAEFGDTVHTREPGEFDGARKQNDLDDVDTQDVTARKVQVDLDQRVYVSFVIGDGQQSLSFKDLIRIYLEPAIKANARTIDQCLAAEVVQFRDNAAGGLEMMNENNAHQYLLDARKILNDNKVGADGRWLALASNSESKLQKVELFKDAGSVGDDGSALENAILGRKEGLNLFLELNTPSVQNATAGSVSTAVNGAVSKGANTLTVTSASGLSVGDYIVVAGDNTPLRIAAVSTNDLTFTTSFINNIANGAAVVNTANKAVNQASAITAGDKNPAVANGYPQHWVKSINIDGGTVEPHVGQILSFAGTSAEYVIISRFALGGGEWTVKLDRPLEDSVANNAVVNLGPSGDMNFFYQRDALTLVNRPLAMPMEGTGVRAGQAFDSNISLRVTISYDALKEGTRVTVGGLFGKKKLNGKRGGVLYG